MTQVRLTDYDLARYSRQMMIEGWGEAGQVRLKQARVLVVGAGGLGSPVLLYLAAAGVGELRICDADTVDLSNLNRQVLHTDARVGELKACSAALTLQALNPSITIRPFAERLDACNVERIAGRPDVIVDCLDNFDTRYLLNAYAIAHGIPLVHGAIWGMMGQVTFIHAPETPCLRCIFPEAPPKATFPVVGATPGIAGCIQAMEVLKYLTGVGTPLKGKLLLFAGEDGSFDTVRIRRLPDCPACGQLVLAPRA